MRKDIKDGGTTCRTKYLAAAITCDPKLKMKDQNIAEQYALVEEAAKKGAKLIALPEMSTTGYCWSLTAADWSEEQSSTAEAA